MIEDLLNRKIELAVIKAKSDVEANLLNIIMVSGQEFTDITSHYFSKGLTNSKKQIAFLGFTVLQVLGALSFNTRVSDMLVDLFRERGKEVTLGEVVLLSHTLSFLRDKLAEKNQTEFFLEKFLAHLKERSLQ